jgi:periplasmic divalent cation tolerance protein
MPTTDHVVVLTTLPTDTDAAELALALIEERLAACVSIYQEMQSFYRWGDTVEQDTERQIVIKTTTDQLGALWDRIRNVHPYEVPEFLVLPIIDGSEAYLRWMRESTGIGR